LSDFPRLETWEAVMDDLIYIILGAACFVGMGLYGRLLRAL
jgi:hypothetical protein